MNELKVGSKVRLLKLYDNQAWYEQRGLIGKVYTVLPRSWSTFATIDCPHRLGGPSIGVTESEIELIKEEDMSILEDVNNLGLDEDTKLLKKYNVEDNTGTITSDGEQIILALLYRDEKFRKTLIDAIKKIDKEKESIRIKDNK